MIFFSISYSFMFEKVSTVLLYPPQGLFSMLDLDVSVNIHCSVVHYFPFSPSPFNYVLGIQSNKCTHVLEPSYYNYHMNPYKMYSGSTEGDIIM